VSAFAQRERVSRLHLPAPIGGLNTVSAGVDMPATDSILSYNLIGAEYGLRSRLGWREWCTGLDGEQVRSLLPFTGSTADGAANRLFACTTSGIWDVSASSAAPTKVLTFGTQNGDSGWGVSTVFVTAAGHFLCYCDEANGYHVYSESGGTWTVGGLSGNPVTGVTPGNLAFVMPWKNRLWFVERDTAKGWYLDIGAVTGAATSFNFGQRFQRGGDLRGLWSWTREGGVGPDDYLVAVSGGGDVVVYAGTDPSQASTFALVNVWYLGAVPAGRRICSDLGGDLLVMSSTGIQSMSKLVAGGSAFSSQYETAKVANLWNQLQSATSTLRGWAMRLHPLDACLMTLVPVAANQATQQLVMSLSTKGWHQYRDMPMGVCAEPWGGTLYFGTEDGRVCVNDGYVDGVALSNPDSYSPIAWSLLTKFGNLGDPRQKRVQLMRATVLSQAGAVPYEARARYSWNLSEIAALSAAAGDQSSSWDSADWDDAIWGGAYQAQSRMFGGSGCGPEVAIALRGAASSRMTLTGIDVAFDTGGFR
jgi:hypothetical protein